ncbi:1-phosphofructokinase family hexose kinase [Agromyces ramosus]|uniref:1-phosphofructokinase family hexose kinase n=1 Tax=Agromyces ramosus TaxID=33879 RepID=A0ABU0R7G8_9MICO|nr:hexose kinase [Agromyces ramosus]MDQ0893126.1 1-phosphofructokinase family hexose kinase [Agromyces ramosus]
MILTVTPNPALDLTWHVEALSPGATHRVPTAAARAGGKGLNVARVLHGAGHEVLALATTGGATGAEFTAELAASGVPHRLLAVRAPTRRSAAIVDDRRGETVVLNELGGPLAAEESTALHDSAVQLARDAGVVAICGSLPPGFGAEHLGELVAAIAASGVPVVADTSGPALLAAARAGAHVVKPNREELEQATGRAEPLAGARALLDLGAHLIVVSLGTEGLLVVGRSGAPVHARLPEPLHGNATGAGDAAVAAIAAALATGVDLAADTDAAARARLDLARRATAWSASAVLMPLAGELSPRHAELEAAVVATPIHEESR